MTKTLVRVLRTVILVAVTAVAIGVMWWASRKGDEIDPFAEGVGVATAPLGAQPRTLVKAVPVEAAMRDITIRYSGKIVPWEDYSLGFEIGGRVATLGENSDGAPLDDGDRVEKGQLLARLDDRVLRAQLAEAVSNLELAVTDLQRSQRIRERTPGAVTESDYLAEVNRQAQARSGQQMAEKRLEDALLVSPITGVIAKRMVEAGESVNANETVFEIVENDRLRLVVNVPEARVRELELRRRDVEAARADGSAQADPEASAFRAHVRLEGSDLYGNSWPIIKAKVYRISETADPVTGLFEVEIFIDNRDGLLRPGMVATADIVTDRLLAYELPEAAVLFRAGMTYAFTVDGHSTEMPVMFWEVGETEIERARKVQLNRWVDQGEVVLIPAGEQIELANVVTRGQQRLRDGQLVRTIQVAGDDSDAESPSPTASARMP